MIPCLVSWNTRIRVLYTFEEEKGVFASFSKIEY